MLLDVLMDFLLIEVFLFLFLIIFDILLIVLVLSLKYLIQFELLDRLKVIEIFCSRLCWMFYRIRH